MKSFTLKCSLIVASVFAPSARAAEELLPKYITPQTQKAIKNGLDYLAKVQSTDGNYPNSQDGWYVPTGGNFFYGITGGFSFKNNDVYLKFGETVTQDFTTKAAVPLYAQVGMNVRF